MTLPPYNPDATCPKCGGAEISHAVARPALDAVAWLPIEAGSEDEHHVCHSCGYAWPEAPMDAKEDTE